MLYVKSWHFPICPTDTPALPVGRFPKGRKTILLGFKKRLFRKDTKRHGDSQSLIINLTTKGAMVCTRFAKKYANSDAEIAITKNSYAIIAAMPGKVFPSSISSIAPPPVET